MAQYKDDPYILIPIWWLDDYRIASLSDHEFVEMVMKMCNNPDNWHYHSVSPMRLEFQRIRKNIYNELFERDDHKCKYCGTTEKLTIDHIRPLARGGSNELDNLQILCRSCNSKKWANYYG